MKITFLRHAETEHNAARRWQGHAAGVLSEEGRLQARTVGERLGAEGFDIVVSSDLGRALETADLAGLAAEPSADWREIDVGEWSGRSHADVAEHDGATLAAMRRGEPVRLGRTGETLPAFAGRVRAAFEKLAARIPEDGAALVITHGGVIRSLVADAWDLSFPNRTAGVIGNSSLTTFAQEFGHWRLAGFNDVGHLGPDAAFRLEPGDRIVTLARHGETDANTKQVWQGQTDWGLNDTGRLQAKALAGWFGAPAALVSSPLGRAVETATVVAGGPPATHDGLMEMSMGDWENLHTDDIKAGWPDLFRSIYQDKTDARRGVSGESVADLTRRMSAAMDDLVAQSAGDLMVVSHGSAIRSFVVSILGNGYHRFLATGLMPNTGLAQVVIGNRPPRLQNYGVAAHLSVF